MSKSVVRGTIDLTGIAAGTYVYSDPINVNDFSEEGNFNLWSLVSGNPGATGSGVSIVWDGNFHSESGSTYWVTPTSTSFIRESGTSINGPNGNGIDANSFSPSIFPWLRLKARHDGSATTSTAMVNYTLIFE